MNWKQLTVATNVLSKIFQYLLNLIFFEKGKYIFKFCIPIIIKRGIKILNAMKQNGVMYCIDNGGAK